MPKIDLREYKKLLRCKMRTIRREMPPEIKQKRDERIFEQLIALREYREAKMIVTYVSTDIEVDTMRLIRHSLEAGKQVAVPRCDETIKGKMTFYIIDSFDKLEVGKYGLLEPSPERCPEVADWSDSICIVPALCYDSMGYRLGYGGGYYDRFLSCYKGRKIGIVYSSCMTTKLNPGRYDVPVDTIVTERFIKNPKASARAFRGRRSFNRNITAR